MEYSFSFFGIFIENDQIENIFPLSNKVAMKIVDKRSLDAENLAKIEREIQILQRLSHPFIVKLFEVIRTERCLYIVTEYVPNGELFG